MGSKPISTIKYVTGTYRLVSNETTRIVGKRPGQDGMGYGLAITTDIVLQFADTGRKHRVYCTCVSNNGSLWIKVRGEKMFLGTVFNSDIVEKFYEDSN